MRLITRPSLDGVMCAVFLGIVEKFEQVIYANPSDIEDGSQTVEKGDYIANLPYNPNAGAWFDHHELAEIVHDVMPSVKGSRGQASSSSRLVYEYYEEQRLKKFEPILTEVDRISTGDLTVDEVLNPERWVLLSFTLDPYLGLSGFHDYANVVVTALRQGLNIEQILDIPEVQGRIKRYRLDVEDFIDYLHQVSRVEDNVLVTDSRLSDLAPTGNRFLAFALYPDVNVQIVITKHSGKAKTRVRLGKSIFNRTCSIRLGNLAAEYGGGGLRGASGFLLDNATADATIAEIIVRLKGH